MVTINLLCISSKYANFEHLILSFRQKKMVKTRGETLVFALCSVQIFLTFFVLSLVFTDYWINPLKLKLKKKYFDYTNII